MNIQKITHSQLTEAVTLVYDEKAPCRIRRSGVYGPKMNHRHHKGIVYFISINDEIVKIGGSSTDIGSLISQYMINLESKAEPRENRFCIHLKMLNRLYHGHVIKFHFIPVMDMMTQLQGMFGETLTTHHREFRIVESRLIEQFTTVTGAVPAWNNSEGSIGWEEELIEVFDKREMGLKVGNKEFFSYNNYIAEFA